MPRLLQGDLQWTDDTFGVSLQHARAVGLDLLGLLPAPGSTGRIQRRERIQPAASNSTLPFSWAPDCDRRYQAEKPDPV